MSGQSGTDGPAFADGASEVTMQSAQQSSFEGEHQLAVLSEPTPYTAMVAFDVIAGRGRNCVTCERLPAGCGFVQGGLPQN